jgi:hypothetical protein
MNSTVHPVAPEEVMALLDGELSAANAQAVSAHLEHCGECATLAEEFLSASQSLSHWKVAAVTAKLESSVADLAAKSHADLNIGKAKILIRASLWTWQQRTVAFGATAAALLLVVFIATSGLLRSKTGLSHPFSLAQSHIQAIGAAGTGALGGQPISDQQSKELNKAVTLHSPGVRADSNGLFHGLGDHLDNAVDVDGPIAPMIARSVSLSIVVKDFRASRATLELILARHRSYAAELSANTAENAPRSLGASLRVPAAELASVLGELKSLGRVENETQSGEEVTQQHADLVARLKNSRETEQRLQAILLERTGKISDVLAVEQEIARVRGEIEQMEAEQKTLEHRVEFAAVNLQLTEEYKAQLGAPAASVSTRFHNAFVRGYREASETVLGVALFFVEYTPTLLIWLAILGMPVILVWRRYRRTLAAI